MIRIKNKSTEVKIKNFFIYFDNMLLAQARVGEAKVQWGNICDALPWEENKREEELRG